jgi:hypothetical protein
MRFFYLLLHAAAPVCWLGFRVGVVGLTGLIVSSVLALGTAGAAPDPTITIHDAEVVEGDGGTSHAEFTVELSEPWPFEITVEYATEDGEAEAPLDYEADEDTVTFAPGDTVETITVDVRGDVVDEETGDEDFFVVLADAVDENALAIEIERDTAVGLIVGDDQTLEIDGTSVFEGDSGTTEATLAVALSSVSSRHVTVDYRTVDGTARAGSDYAGESGTLTFSPGELSETITIDVKGDTLAEGEEEEFTVLLNDASHADIATSRGAVTILDDDATIEIGDVAVAEPDSGTTDALFEVNLSAPAFSHVTVHYRTVEGSALAGDDFESRSGTLTFSPGEVSETVSVPVKSDALRDALEDDELFFVELFDASGATIGDGVGEGTIVDADVTIEVMDVAVMEGADKAIVEVKLNKPIDETVRVRYATRDGSAVEPDDYTEQSGTLSFSPGEAGKSILIDIEDDKIAEEEEIFYLELSSPSNAKVLDGQSEITLLDNEDLIGIEDVVVTEGDSRGLEASFPVILSAPSPDTVTVEWRTVDGTATAPDDYEKTSGTVTFAPGQVSRTIEVTIVNDDIDEGASEPEVFFIDLSNPRGARVADTRAEAEIVDDDLTIAIEDAEVAEEDEEDVGAVFTLRLSSESGRTVEVSYRTRDDSAVADEDYEAVSDTVVFPPGEVEAEIEVSVLADLDDEPEETFILELFDPVNARLDRDEAEATIEASDRGYWMVGSDGGVFAFGDTDFLGSTGDVPLNSPVVGMAPTVKGNGYWLVAADGGIFTFGDAAFLGSTGGVKLNRPIVGMASNPAGNGYWLVASDGGIFSFGDAPFFGSTGAVRLNRPIVGMASTPTGRGYWLVASDGGIFSFGDAAFFGSTGGVRLQRPIVGMVPTPTGRGYWLVASDGGVFTFGNAGFMGSTGGTKLNSPIIGMARNTKADGYWLVAADGGVFAFGDAEFMGSTGDLKLTRPIVGAAVLPAARPRRNP